MVVARTAMQLFWGAVAAGSGWMAAQSSGDFPPSAPAGHEGAGSTVASAWLDLKWHRDLAASAAAAAPPTGDPPECRTAAADFVDPSEAERRAFPIPEPHRFAADLLPIVERAHIEHMRCRGRGDDPDTFRACNRRDCATMELETRGWCTTSEGSSAVFGWRRCADMADRTPRDREVPYPEEEIRRMFPPEATPLDAAFSNAELQFFDEAGDALPPGNPLARMRRETGARLAACASDPCRRRIEADALDRLGFARDRERARSQEGPAVPHVPLRTGILHIEGDPRQGSMSLLPIGGDEILLLVAPNPTEQIRRRCHGVVAHGRLARDGGALMTSLDGTGLRFALRIVSPAQVELRPIGGSGVRHPPLCAQGDTIFGRYETLAPLS